MAVDQLAVNLGVGLPIVIYYLILSTIAVKVDENERDDEEADAAVCIVFFYYLCTVCTRNSEGCSCICCVFLDTHVANAVE